MLKKLAGLDGKGFALHKHDFRVFAEYSTAGGHGEL
jgi:hypothetical protein